MDERKVISEIIELYRDLPCLWDITCEEYKDNNKKRSAWELLVTKFKEIDPDANVASVRKKIENLKSSYKREAAKVKESKKSGSGASDVHKPNLWYFSLMTFLDSKQHLKRSGVDTFSSDDESSPPTAKRKGNRVLEKKREKLLDTANSLLQQTTKEYNAFGIYVGEQMERLSTQQRPIAEKLISDVIFLAKTENLNINARVDPGVRSSFIPQHRSKSPSVILPEYNSSSPEYGYSPQMTVQSQPSPHYDSSSSCLPLLSSPKYFLTPSPSSDQCSRFEVIQPTGNFTHANQHTVELSILSPIASQTVQPTDSSTQSNQHTVELSIPSPIASQTVQPTDSSTHSIQHTVELSIPSPIASQTVQPTDSSTHDSVGGLTVERSTRNRKVPSSILPTG